MTSSSTGGGVAAFLILGTASLINLAPPLPGCCDFKRTKSLLLKCFEHKNKFLASSISVKLQNFFHNLFIAGSRGNLQ